MSKSNKWIGSATSNKGALHRNLGVPEGQKTPASKLATKPNDSTTVKREKALARTLGKMRKG
jgi:hypothetical protein